jgi:hypothetical protein
MISLCVFDYLSGGYFFGSISMYNCSQLFITAHYGIPDTHRYQIIRYGTVDKTHGNNPANHHLLTARKMKGRAFAMNYR